jgi:phosphate:Na+ symporter
MAGAGLITLPAGIALIFGANIGTCVTAALAAIGKPREAARAAVVHALFNIVGVLIWFPFIGWLAELVTQFSPASPELTDTARLAAETPRQIANAHTLFNIVNTVVMIGFAPLFARAAERLAPDVPVEVDQPIRPKYLDDELIETPALALDRSRLEILRQGELVQEMLREALPAVLEGDEEQIEVIDAHDDVVDHLHGAIVTYLGRISQESLDRASTAELMRLMAAANDLESIGDIVSRDLRDLGEKRRANDVTVSPQTREVIGNYHAEVAKALAMSIQAVTQKNTDAAKIVVKMKSDMQEAMSDAAAHEAARLVADEPNRLAAYRLETDLIESLNRIYYFTKRMARGVIRAPDEKP